jgi:hypothetical protein
VIALTLVTLGMILKPRDKSHELYEFSIVEPRYLPGGIYSIQAVRRATKLLRSWWEKEIVYIRLYKNVFSERPRQVDLSILNLGNINDSDGFGIGRAAITR